ncbi:MAG: hypothetical protein ACR5LD_10615 [Symbiopectobacterium sp.]
MKIEPMHKTNWQPLKLMLLLPALLIDSLHAKAERLAKRLAESERASSAGIGSSPLPISNSRLTCDRAYDSLTAK